MLTNEQQTVANSIKELVEILPVITLLERAIPENPTNLEHLAHTAFVCRKTAEILDTVRKKIEEVGARAENQACVTMQVSNMPNYKAEYCTISPNPDLILNIPYSPKIEGFEDFIKALPPKALRPHYPTVVELVKEEFMQGKGLPFGLKPDKIKGASLKCRILGRKDI